MIAAFSAAEFYHGKLKTGITAADRPPLQGFRWPQKDAGIAFRHSEGPESREGESRQNLREAEIVLEILADVLAEKELGVLDVGIVSPYAAQVRLLRKTLRRELPGRLRRHGVDLTGGLPGRQGQRALEIASVDAFQGREKELIIFSAVRSNKHGNVGFLQDWRRLNVMITRARRGLIVVGNTSTLKGDASWGRWLEWANENGLIVGNTGSGPSSDHRLSLTDTQWGSASSSSRRRTNWDGRGETQAKPDKGEAFVSWDDRGAHASKRAAEWSSEAHGSKRPAREYVQHAANAEDPMAAFFKDACTPSASSTKDAMVASLRNSWSPIAPSNNAPSDRDSMAEFFKESNGSWAAPRPQETVMASNSSSGLAGFEQIRQLVGSRQNQRTPSAQETFPSRSSPWNPTSVSSSSATSGGAPSAQDSWGTAADPMDDFFKQLSSVEASLDASSGMRPTLQVPAMMSISSLTSMLGGSQMTTQQAAPAGQNLPQAAVWRATQPLRQGGWQATNANLSAASPAAQPPRQVGGWNQQSW